MNRDGRDLGVHMKVFRVAPFCVTVNFRHSATWQYYISPLRPLLDSGRLLLFPRMKVDLKGQSSDVIEAIQPAVMAALNEVPVELF